MIELWTDGACSGNGQENASGGWGFAVYINDELKAYGSGWVEDTTNQRMEMQAIIEGLDFLEKNYEINFEEIRVFTDSAYCLNCWKQNWWKNWVANGWKTSKKEPVKNKDLWLKLIPWFGTSSLQFNMVKVKGHSGNKRNDFVDELARSAAEPLIKILGDKN